MCSHPFPVTEGLYVTDEVIIVSGLPRSGTSLMMQLLDAGGIEVVTDNLRTADTDNPRGYYEFEKVKQVKRDVSWLPGIRGKGVKMVSQLLFDLPPTERYRVVFMERDFTEMLDSQESMLRRLGRAPIARETIIPAYTSHLERVQAWLQRQPHLAVLRVRYKALVERPDAEVARVNEFLGGRLNVTRAVAAVDPSLYRNRTAASEPSGSSG
jgi:hypothetical protein